jgi:hypothetical protein
MARPDSSGRDFFMWAFTLTAWLFLFGLPQRTIYQSSNEPRFSVTIADAPGSDNVSPDRNYWGKDAVLTVVLQDESGQITTVATVPNPMGECNVAVDHADASSLVLSRTTTDYGILLSSLKLFIDPDTKRMIRTIEFWPAVVDALWAEGESLFAQFSPQDPYRQTPAMFEERAGRFDVARGAFTIPGRQGLPPGWIMVETGEAPQEFSAIRENAAAPPRTYEVPKTDRQTLERLRPKAVRDEFGPREVAEINDYIGPYQLLNNVLWFGKTFYDGEGLTGVGGFGYFDLTSRRYVMFTPASILDWSASAILVEADAIWIGLVNRPEGADNPGGLLRYDRKTMQTRVYPIKDVITRIVRHNGILYSGTQQGLYLMRDDNFTRYVLEPTTVGPLALIQVPVL